MPGFVDPKSSFTTVRLSEPRLFSVSRVHSTLRLCDGSAPLEWAELSLLFMSEALLPFNGMTLWACPVWRTPCSNLLRPSGSRKTIRLRVVPAATYLFR